MFSMLHNVKSGLKHAIYICSRSCTVSITDDQRSFDKITTTRISIVGKLQSIRLEVYSRTCSLMIVSTNSCATIIGMIGKEPVSKRAPYHIARDDLQIERDHEVKQPGQVLAMNQAFVNNSEKQRGSSSAMI